MNRILGALLLVAAMVTTAAADCGWIAWSSPRTLPTRWQPMSAYESKKECVASLYDWRQLDPGNMVGCWPATFDLR
jgi:hypothetical protein